jgi:hypothetical protein
MLLPPLRHSSRCVSDSDHLVDAAAIFVPLPVQKSDTKCLFRNQHARYWYGYLPVASVLVYLSTSLSFNPSACLLIQSSTIAPKQSSTTFAYCLGCQTSRLRMMYILIIASRKSRTILCCRRRRALLLINMTCIVWESIRSFDATSASCPSLHTLWS